MIMIIIVMIVLDEWFPPSAAHEDRPPDARGEEEGAQGAYNIIVYHSIL